MNVRSTCKSSFTAKTSAVLLPITSELSIKRRTQQGYRIWGLVHRGDKLTSPEKIASYQLGQKNLIIKVLL